MNNLHPLEEIKMKLYVNVLKHLFTVLFLTGISLQAAPIIAEQILPANGGDSVAISGEWAFVGDTDQCEVAIYKYNYITNKWGNGAGIEDIPYDTISGKGGCKASKYKSFGASVSTSNNLLIVGAPEAKDGGNSNYGIIYFYTLVNGVWTENTTVGEAVNADGSSDTQDLAAFGQSVSVRYGENIEKAIVLVGAPKYDSGANLDAGKVYLYEWDNLTENINFIGAVEGENPGDGFGSAVTSNGIRFIGSAPYFGPNDTGKVYLYDFNRTAKTIGFKQSYSSGDGNMPVLTKDTYLGISLSLNILGNMLLGGSDTFVLKRGDDGLYKYDQTLIDTFDGDVSQSGNVAAVGYTGSSVQVYSDYRAIDGSPDLKIDNPEADYGRDISVSDARLMVNGNTNNQAYAYYFPCGQGGTLEAMKWTMIGLQCDVDGAPISEIFSDLGTYDDNWVVYEQNGTDYKGHQAAYAKLDPTDTMKLGVGYWIISDTNATWQINDTISTASTVGSTPSEVDPLARDDIGAVHGINLNDIISEKTTPTSNIKIMLSNPYPYEISWGNVLLSSNGTSGFLSENPSFFEEGSVTAYVVNSDTGGYTPIAYTPGISPKLKPGEGFYVRLSESFDNLAPIIVYNFLISVEK